MTKAETCFFSGHRRLFPKASREQLPRLQSALESCVIDLCAQGFRQFVCGGALGFDTLAAQTVLLLRDDGTTPGATLHLVLPCRDQDKNWPEKNRRTYREILSQADLVTYTRETYTPDCMLLRDRAMADLSSLGVFFYSGRKRGGTAYTYRYFSSLSGARSLNLFPLFCPAQTKNAP